MDYNDEESDVFQPVRPLLHKASTDSATNATAAAATATAAATLNNLVRSPVTSRPGSRAQSPLGSATSDDDAPTNVSTEEQLSDLPEECLSGDPVRPLQHFDEDGNVFHYALRPMVYSVFMILLTEGVERFAFYGINYTQTSYLTGTYDKNWNAGMYAISASSVRSRSTVSFDILIYYAASRIFSLTLPSHFDFCYR